MKGVYCVRIKVHILYVHGVRVGAVRVFGGAKMTRP